MSDASINFHLGKTPTAPTGALAGKGILITRPMWQAVALVEKLATTGAVPFIFPAIIISTNAAIDLAAAQSRLANCSRAFFVSANAVREGLMGMKTFPTHVRAYAPGPGTAEALTTCGAKTICFPEKNFDTTGLLAMQELQSLRGERVMVFTGVDGKGDLAAGLRARGAEVDVVECYRRSAPQTMATGVEEAFTGNMIHASVLTSAEGIENFWNCLTDAGRNALRTVPAFVPHPNVADAARAKGIETVVVTAPGDAALVEALFAHFKTSAVL